VRDLILVLVTMFKWIPLAKLMDLAKALKPLPASWTDESELRAWLSRVGIGGPLGDLIVAQLLALTPTWGAVPDEELEEMVSDQVAAAGISPELIALIMQIVQMVIQMLLNRKTTTQPPNPPGPAVN
jgi:hypothetical protein